MNSGAPERWAVPAPKIVIIDNVNNFFGKPETAMIYITFCCITNHNNTHPPI
jgi:hypothetical protein